MSVDSRNNHLEGLRRGIDFAITPLRYAINAPFALFSWGNQQLSTHNTLINENTTLRQANLDLLTRQQKLEILQRENLRLRELLGSSQQVTERSLVAELLTVALDPYSQQITINKGLRDEVYAGQPIISAEGIMGQVTHTGELSSTVLLISDAKHDIPVQSNRSGLRTLARGTGIANELELLHIPNSADLQEGDLMISSSLGGRFPRNYPVAVVTQIKRKPGQPFAKVTAKPTAKLDQSSEVLLIWPIRTELNQSTSDDAVIQEDKPDA
jgi:rod shape-determining protein MreC